MEKINDKSLPMVSDLTTCESTQQMLEKARKDGVVTAWDRAVDMKPCPIGVESACCKMCHMGLGRKLSSSLGVSHELPPQGYYNAGQKAFAVVSVLLGLGIVASGVLLAASTSLNAQQFPVLVMLVPWAIALHHFSVGGVLAGLLVHIYMAAISPDERPGLVSMFTGTVPLDYAQHHHPLWDTPELNRCRIAPRHTHRNPTAEKE